MLEPILKGLVEWIYALMVEIMSYASGELLGVLSMNLDYFEDTAPVISEIVNVFVALGWALLIGNMVFQLVKSMASGLGFEAEDPKIIFLRTFVFSFLLMASRQICDIGLSITGRVIDLLEMPSSIEIVTPDESMFSLGGEAKWLLVIIVGVVLMVQMVKLLFEIGERYVITSVLTFFSPLAFAMGGSRNTNDIFKGWCRMYGSMMILMIMNIVFLKLIMSAMSQISSGGVLIWLVFVVALTRVARKIDSHIGKLGLNPAHTGDGLGSRIPGMMTVMAARALGSTVSRSIRGASSAASSGASGGQKNRSGATHAHRQPNPYENRPSPVRRDAAGGLGGASYYMGEGSPSESSTSTSSVGGAVVTGGTTFVGGASAGGHGGSNMSSSTVNGGSSELLNSQSSMAGDVQTSGTPPIASAEHRPQGTSGGQPPLQRKTSAGKAPTGIPSGRGNTGAQPTNGGTEIRNAESAANTSLADIHGSEAAAMRQGSSVPLPKSDAPTAAQPGKSQSGGAVSQSSNAASSQHSSLESHGGGATLPRAGAPSEAAAPGRDTVSVQGTGVRGATAPLPKAGTSQSGTTRDGQSATTQFTGSQSGSSRAETSRGEIPNNGHGAVPLPKDGNVHGSSTSAAASSQVSGANTDVVHNRNGTAHLPKAESGGASPTAQKPDGTSRSAVPKNTGTVPAGNQAGGQTQQKSSAPASLPKSGGSAGATAMPANGGVSVRASENSSVNVSNVQKSTADHGAVGAQPQPASGGEKPHNSSDGRTAAHQDAAPRPKIQSTHENTGKTGAVAAGSGAQNIAQQGQHGSQSGMSNAAREKSSALGGSPISAGKESTVINNGASAPSATGNTVVNKSTQPSDAGHGDKGQASKVTSFERGGDTNIESRNYTAPERTVEKEVKPEYGKDEHLADKKSDRPGKAPGVHANTTFSRNRGPAENGERINHDYTHGKYDPAANNHKTDNQFFVKETLRGSRIKRERMKSKRVLKRGGKNGSGKQ